MRSALLLLAGVVVLGTSGCMSVADPLGHRNALEDAQKRYTDLIRWRDAERAAIFVDPELRKEFLEHAKALETLEISDYELGDLEFGDGDETAKVDVTYRGYSLSHLIERKVRVTQEWHRNEGNTWLVRPDLEDVVAELRGLPHQAR
jgi:hypothetical protein